MSPNRFPPYRRARSISLPRAAARKITTDAFWCYTNVMAATEYPSYADLRARRLAERRAAAVRVLVEAEARVREAGGRLVVFGSLAEGGFDERSDLDVALLGLEQGRDSEVAAEVDTQLSLAGFEADVIAERFLSPSLRARVIEKGREPSNLE